MNHMAKELHWTIKKFLEDGWNSEYPEEEWYIAIDVIYPEGPISHVITSQEGFNNFCGSLKKPTSEIVRLVWRYQRR